MRNKDQDLDQIRDAHRKIVAVHLSAQTQFDSDMCERLLKQELQLIKRKSHGNGTKAWLLANAGIDMSKHSKQPLKAFIDMTGLSKREFLLRLIKAMSANGIDLSDGAMNTEKPINLQAHLPEYECSHCVNCIQVKEITSRSIYAQCLKTFKGWNECLSLAGIDAKIYQRKIASREPTQYTEAVFKIFRGDAKWNANTVRSNKVAWNLRHQRNQKGLILYNSEVDPEIVKDGRWLFAAWVQYRAEEAGLEPISYYRTNKEALWTEYRVNHLGQEVWEEGRLEKEIMKVFAEGRRITRYELSESSNQWDRTLLAATRAVKKREAGDDHNDVLRQAGFIPNTLQAIYREEDDPWTRVRCLKEAQRLMSIHLQTAEPTLSREWCSRNAKEFHDALLRKVNGKSWESALRWIGIDPKKFSLHASTRTKRGLVFQDFFKDCLIEAGFIEQSEELSIKSHIHFMTAKSLNDCKHQVNCRPDFVFKDFIVDTKTGIGAISNESDQLIRYCDHRKTVYLVTLNNNHQTKRIGNGVVVTFSFEEFVCNSEHILGLPFPQDAPQRLTQVFRDTIFEKKLVLNN